jgi:putative Mg2+ transporter-C (MgtC) family protein
MFLGSIDNWDNQLDAWTAALGWPMEGLLRLVAAAVLGGAVGLDREIRGRQAGFRTNILVCLGSALVMLVSIRFAAHSWPHPPGININVDPARIAYGVMTGVGFLGAGTIIHTKGAIRGLTTAAALWCVAGIGLAAGFGAYLLAFMATVVVVVVLWLFDYIENIVPRLRYRIVTFRGPYHFGCVNELADRFRGVGVKVSDTSYKRCEDNLSQVDIDLHVVFNNQTRYDALLRQIDSEGKYQLLAGKDVGV